MPQPTRAQILERRDQLVALLAETDHQAGLGRDAGRMAARAVQQLQRPRVAPSRPRHPVESRHRLGVVVEHVGPRVEHRVERRFIPLKVRNQHFDPAAGQPRTRLADGVGEDRRAAVRQIVAVDRGDDDVVEVERADGVGDARRFGGVDRARAAVRDGAVREQARVQTSPRIMNVAVPWFQHSPMFGHCASSQTVCRFSSRISPLRRGSSATPARAPSAIRASAGVASRGKAG